MASFELKLNLAGLPDMLSAMREWLNDDKSNITHFSAASDVEGLVRISLGFDAGDNHSESFSRRFSAKATLLQSK